MTEQSFTAATPNNTIFVRVALGGHTLGVQIEPAAMRRPAAEIAQRIMACNDVAYLKGDWTRQDPAITDFLRDHGRDGVPLYIYYPPGGAPPVVLPQILTESMLLDRIQQS